MFCIAWMNELDVMVKQFTCWLFCVFSEEVVKIAKVRVIFLCLSNSFWCARTSSLFDRSEGGISFAAYGLLLLSKSIKSRSTLNCIDLQSFFSVNMAVCLINLVCLIFVYFLIRNMENVPLPGNHLPWMMLFQLKQEKYALLWSHLSSKSFVSHCCCICWFFTWLVWLFVYFISFFNFCCRLWIQELYRLQASLGCLECSRM